MKGDPLSPLPTHAPLESGAMVDLARPNPATITIRDIAAGLSKINRFAGATALPYSVAQHCCVVARILRDGGAGLETELYGLLHDAHEAMVGDIPSPVVVALGRCRSDTKEDISYLKKKLDAAIFAAVGLAPEMPALVEADVSYADRTALVTEARDLMAAPLSLPGHPAPASFTITPAGHYTKAMQEFLDTFEELSIAVGLVEIDPPV